MPRPSLHLGQRHPPRSLTQGIDLKEQHRQTVTVAILGTDTVVGCAISSLLEESGYGPIPLDSYPTGVVDELPAGAHLLLFVLRVGEVNAKPS